ncbi:MAG TPA: HAMP domain-containing sensor histidine kinase [Thermoleophilia bacterium]
MSTDEQQPSAVRYVDPFRDRQALAPISGEERTILRTVNQKIAARPSLRAIVDYLFDNTQGLIPCDRIGLAFVDERGERVTSYYNRANYANLAIDKDYSEALQQTSLREVLDTGQPRIIGNLELYLEARPRSRSTRRLLQEGVRSNLTCPLSVEGRVVGFIFRSSRRTYTYRTRHIELQMAITERLSQAVEKAWRIEQLEELNHAYTQMLGFVSHELKSPVASMVTDAQLLSQGYLGDLTEAQQSKLEGIVRKGDYLLGLVNEYLDLARVEGGELQTDLRSRVNVNEDVIGVAVDLVRPQIDAHGVNLVTELPAEPVPLICCDATLLRIVLVNLLDNAVKYGNEGGEIRLSAELAPARRGSPPKLKVAVRNEGPGFSQGEKNKLFRRFSRLDDPALKTRRGTGVGLYNAWRVIQLHKGRITADSKRGEWAEFCFEIPAAPDCAGPPAAERGSGT